MLPTILLQADAQPQAWWGNVILIGGIIIIFYFFMVRPQQRKQKQHKSFVDSLKRGDRVVTIGGMHGRVVEIVDDAVVLDVDRGTKLTFEKSAISVEASKRFSPQTKETKAEA
ncbi:preprotein translocase subunit YajC [Flammeovirgaceae bacterium 311]|nr:preprotein translocase subunit YajC [Flammeovirgaceae bacterium 311]